MNRADNVILESLIHLLKIILEDLREDDAAGLLLMGMPQPIYHHHHYYRKNLYGVRSSAPARPATVDDKQVQPWGRGERATVQGGPC
jgi:hypothetical protein